MASENSIEGAEAKNKAQPNESTGEQVNIDNVREAFAATQAYNCLECGKCTGICPVALTNTGFSPRLIVKKALLEFEDELCRDKELWDCLTCGLCLARCRSDVNLPEFIRRLRLESIKLGNNYLYTHNNVFTLIPKLQLRTGEFQKRLDWLTTDIKYQSKGDVLFFVGCAPYHQTIFKESNQDNLSLPMASLKLMNAAGVEPVLLADERCCGHDAFWTGDQDTFEKLAKLNVASFIKAGVKQIVTACPEGHHMLKHIYPEYAESYDFECLHITEFITAKLESGELAVPVTTGTNGSQNEVVSYHDSCKLGRFSGVYDAPRKIIKAIPGLELHELTHNRVGSTCCGVNSFINCDMNSKNWRQSKLLEAKAAGADTLLTSCPKCNIHLNCYVMNQHVEPRIDIKVESLIVRLAKELNLIN